MSKSHWGQHQTHALHIHQCIHHNTSACPAPSPQEHHSTRVHTQGGARASLALSVYSSLSFLFISLFVSVSLPHTRTRSGITRHVLVCPGTGIQRQSLLRHVHVRGLGEYVWCMCRRQRLRFEHVLQGRTRNTSARVRVHVCVSFFWNQWRKAGSHGNMLCRHGENTAGGVDLQHVLL